MHMIRKAALFGVVFVVFYAPPAEAAGPSQALCEQIYEQTSVLAAGCSAMTKQVVVSGVAEGAPAASTQRQPVRTVKARAHGAQRAGPPASAGSAALLTDRQQESHVFFPSGGQQLDSTAEAQIARIAQVLQTPVMQGACLRLVGHSDSVGAAQANQTLSLARAQRVADQLRGLLPDPTRVQEVMGVGEEEPLSDFDPAARENRRVAFWVRSCTQQTAAR